MDYSVVKKVKSSIFGAKCFSVQIQTSALIMALGEITKCIIGWKIITIVVILLPSLTVAAFALKMSGEPILGAFLE